MGGDNVATLHKWKNYEQLLDQHQIYVYKRPNYELGELARHPKIQFFEAPMLDISATYIRDCIRNKKSIQYLVNEKVFDYLESSKMYK
jgi:nicotinate-nucleotide adenylyltransferase